MIKNKKLFTATILLGAFIIMISMIGFILYVPLNYDSIGVLFIFNSIIGSIIYSILFLCLKKSSIIKKIYIASVVLCCIVLLLGILLLIFF